jgi:serine phosphatase RsbU (regulator of sigma subunit)
MHRRVHLPSVAVFIVCIALTSVVGVLTVIVRDDAEHQLLEDRTGEAAAVLAAAVSGAQVPLAGAAQLAEVTSGAAAPFEAVIGRAVEAGTFASGTLVDAESGDVVTTVGERPALLDAGADRVSAAIEQATGTQGLAVIDTLDLAGRRLGYAWATPGDDPSGRWVVYVEAALPSKYDVPTESGPFDVLDYGLFLGPGQAEADLLWSNMPALPDNGFDAASTVEFGDRELVFATRTDDALAGWLLHWLPWLLVAGGIAFACLAALVTEWLMRRRSEAEHLAADVERLYSAQRNRTETLQRSLVPRVLDVPAGVRLAAAYWPADADDEVGGDFYDVFSLGPDRWGVTIGDVCGKGIDAAALTALTRHTIRAAARHLESPAAVLRWTHEAIDADHAETFATACFGFLRSEPGRFRLDVALGGHPRPLLVHADGTVEEIGTPGTVLGLVEPRLTSASCALLTGDTLLLYTDGLTDVPGDGRLDADALHELVATVAHEESDPAAFADRVGRAVRARRPSGAADDMALLVLHVDDVGSLDEAATRHLALVGPAGDEGTPA